MTIYLDTNILVYLLERHDPYSTTVAQILELFVQDGGTFISSTVTITEFLAGTATTDLHSLRQIPRLEFITLSEEIAKKAASLQRADKLHIGDALHLATALTQKVDTLFTNDTQLAKISQHYLAVKTLGST